MVRKQQDKVRFWIDLLKARDYHVRMRAAYQLGELRDVRAIEPLLLALTEYDLKDEESKVNMCAGVALIKIGEPAFLPLINALKRDAFPQEQRWRYWVANTLGMTGDSRAVNHLIDALEDDEVCEGAAEALGKIGDQRALELLLSTLARLKRTDGYVYVAVSHAIERLQAGSLQVCRMSQ